MDRRPSLGHGHTTPTALIHPVNLLQEVAFYRRRWRAVLRSLFPQKINSLRRLRSWLRLGRRSTAVTRLREFYKEGLGTMIATRPATACIFVAENRLIK